MPLLFPWSAKFAIPRSVSTCIAIKSETRCRRFFTYYCCTVGATFLVFWAVGNDPRIVQFQNATRRDEKGASVSIY